MRIDINVKKDIIYAIINNQKELVNLSKAMELLNKEAIYSRIVNYSEGNITLKIKIAEIK